MVVYNEMHQLAMNRKDANFPESTARYTAAVAEFQTSFLTLTWSKCCGEESAELNRLSDMNAEL